MGDSEYDTCDIILCEGPDALRNAAQGTLNLRACTVPISVTGSASDIFETPNMRAHCVIMVHAASRDSSLDRELSWSEIAGESLYVCNKLTRIATPRATFYAFAQIRANHAVDLAIATRRATAPRPEDHDAIMSRIARMLKLPRVWESISIRAVGAQSIAKPSERQCEVMKKHYSTTAAQFMREDHEPVIRNRMLLVF